MEKFLFVLIIFTACNSSTNTFDKTVETEKILALHHEQRKVHFEKMAEEFTEMMSDNFISVNRGKVTTPSKEENLKRFSGYFNSVEFIKWDDVKPPVIRFSDDGSMAYTIVEKEVVVAYEADEKYYESKTMFSWVAIYKKYGEEWKIDAVASTNLPDELKEIESLPDVQYVQDSL
jgi:hypothetical protein